MKASIKEEHVIGLNDSSYPHTKGPSFNEKTLSISSPYNSSIVEKEEIFKVESHPELSSLASQITELIISTINTTQSHISTSTSIPREKHRVFRENRTCKSASKTIKRMEKLTRTGRVSKSLKGEPVHDCLFPGCEKTYTRAEHLRRHQETKRHWLETPSPGLIGNVYPSGGSSSGSGDRGPALQLPSMSGDLPPTSAAPIWPSNPSHLGHTGLSNNYSPTMANQYGLTATAFGSYGHQTDNASTNYSGLQDPRDPRYVSWNQDGTGRPSNSEPDASHVAYPPGTHVPGTYPSGFVQQQHHSGYPYVPGPWVSGGIDGQFITPQPGQEGTGMPSYSTAFPTGSQGPSNPPSNSYYPHQHNDGRN